MYIHIQIGIMDLPRSDIFLMLVFLSLLGSTAAVWQPPKCKNQTKPMPLINAGDNSTVDTYNCSNSDVQEKTPKAKLNVTDVLSITENSDSDSRLDEGIYDDDEINLVPVNQGGSMDDDASEEVEKTDALGKDEGQADGTKKDPVSGDPVIGEGNLLCPENWICSTKGDNKTLTKPSGVVMKAIPYVGLATLTFMVVMAVSATLWMSRKQGGHGEAFGMKPLPRRNDNMDGCSIVRDTNAVTVNMLAVNNNPKDKVNNIQMDSKRVSHFHEYSLPDVVTNEGIDHRLSRRFVQGESLYMELSDMYNQMGEEEDELGSTSMLIRNKTTTTNRNSDSIRVFYQPVPLLPDIQQDIQHALPNVEHLQDPSLPTFMNHIPVPMDLPQPSDYYPVHIPGFQVPLETLPEIDIYSDLPPHVSVYEVNETKRRSFMPPMDGMSSATNSVAGGSVYTLQGPMLEGDMIRDADAEALYEQIEDRDRLSWITSSSDSGTSCGSNNHPTLAPLLSLVPSRKSLGMDPVMFANAAAHQRENYDKIDRTKRTYKKPREINLPRADCYNTLVMWP